VLDHAKRSKSALAYRELAISLEGRV
jgi:hypothetical protein